MDYEEKEAIKENDKQIIEKYLLDNVLDSIVKIYKKR